MIKVDKKKKKEAATYLLQINLKKKKNIWKSLEEIWVTMPLITVFITGAQV
jgi:hypothetical protein